MANVQLLLLAAGGSSRMGQPKQLMQWGGTPLIAHQISTFLKTGQQLSVVVGAHSEEIIPLIQKFPVNILNHAAWQKGMGSSIAFGMAQLLKKEPTMDAVLLTLIDQPLVSMEYIIEMRKRYRPHRDQIIISRAREGWLGPPVLFDRVYFEDLQGLKGDEGAKSIINKYHETLDFCDGGVMLKDFDTPEAYRELLNLIR